jgi:cytochrome bd ubiquinol oxidase subunit I
MLNVDLARWQFAFTSINHFLFVPVTIGLAFLTALLQTAWQRGAGPGGRASRGTPGRRDEYLRLTRFFGTLLVINVAIGVVAGRLGQAAPPDPPAYDLGRRARQCLIGAVHHGR